MSQGQKYLKAALVLASAVCCQTAMSRVQSCEKFVLDDFSFFFLPIFQREWGIYAPWTIEHIHTNVKRQICFTLPARLNKLKMRLGNVDTGYPWCAAILNRKLLLKIAVMKNPPFLSPFQIQTHMETHSFCLLQCISSPPAVKILDTQAVASIQNQFKTVPATFIGFYINRRDN